MLGRDKGGCPPYAFPRSLFSSLSGPQAAPFNIISLHPQLPPCLLGRLNSQQRQSLHLTVRSVSQDILDIVGVGKERRIKIGP